MLIDHQNETGETVPVDPDYVSETIVTHGTTTADKMHDSIAPKDERPVKQRVKDGFDFLAKEDRALLFEAFEVSSLIEILDGPDDYLEEVLVKINEIREVKE